MIITQLSKLTTQLSPTWHNQVNHDEVRIVNRQHGGRIPEAAAAKIIGLAKATHLELKTKSIEKSRGQVMAHYTAIQGELASIQLSLSALKDPLLRSEIMEARVLTGLNVPGKPPKTNGDPPEASNFHHVSLLKFPAVSVMVDVTAAQLDGPNIKYADTAVLMLISDPKELFQHIREVYCGGQWTLPPL